MFAACFKLEIAGMLLALYGMYGMYRCVLFAEFAAMLKVAHCCAIHRIRLLPHSSGTASDL